jgi:EAL domain-containing protein (putative c-di-GMP-specific phosphodiesterase class I)
MRPDSLLIMDDNEMNRGCAVPSPGAERIFSQPCPDIARTIVMLAHQLGLDVVAEGVETAEQLAQLQSLGCE